MSIHSLPSSQLNTARAVAILTPHLTARADCFVGAVFREESTTNGPSSSSYRILTFISPSSPGIRNIAQSEFVTSHTEALQHGRISPLNQEVVRRFNAAFKLRIKFKGL